MEVAEVILAILVLGFALGFLVRHLSLVREREAKEYLRDIIGSFAKVHVPPYRYTLVQYHHEIFKNGDEHVKRTYRISALDHPLSWIKIRMGASADAALSDMNLRAHRVRGDISTHCATALYENTPRKKRALVIFPNPLPPGKEEEIRVEYTWPKAWRDLVVNMEDTAWYNIDTDIELLEVEITLPKELMIEKIWAEPQIGEIILKTDRVALWTAQKPPHNLYRLCITAKNR